MLVGDFKLRIPFTKLKKPENWGTLKRIDSRVLSSRVLILGRKGSICFSLQPPDKISSRSPHRLKSQMSCPRMWSPSVPSSVPVKRRNIGSWRSVSWSPWKLSSWSHQWWATLQPWAPARGRSTGTTPRPCSRRWDAAGCGPTPSVSVPSWRPAKRDGDGGHCRSSWKIWRWPGGIWPFYMRSEKLWWWAGTNIGQEWCCYRRRVK